jgi:hypothetical protein
MAYRTNRETGGIFPTGDSMTAQVIDNMMKGNGIHISEITSAKMKSAFGVDRAIKGSEQAQRRFW